jgi:hypothetical protein
MDENPAFAVTPGIVVGISAAYYAAKGARIDCKKGVLASEAHELFKIRRDELAKCPPEEANSPVSNKKVAQEIANVIIFCELFEQMIHPDSEIFFRRNWELDGTPFITTWSAGHFLQHMDDQAPVAPPSVTDQVLRQDPASSDHHVLKLMVESNHSSEAENFRKSAGKDELEAIYKRNFGKRKPQRRLAKVNPRANTDVISVPKLKHFYSKKVHLEPVDLARINKQYPGFLDLHDLIELQDIATRQSQPDSPKTQRIKLSLKDQKRLFQGREGSHLTMQQLIRLYKKSRSRVPEHRECPHLGLYVDHPEVRPKFSPDDLYKVYKADPRGLSPADLARVKQGGRRLTWDILNAQLNAKEDRRRSR